MTLQDILAAHQKYSVKHSLKTSLGDAFLLKTNPLYRNIRHAAIELGFRFSPRRFYDYDVLPLTQLPKILGKKVIPYSDNVSCLREIEKRAPRAFGWSEVPPLKANYVLHESAHGVAHELKKIYFKKAKKKDALSKTHALVLQTFIEESFANAVECMANAYLPDAISNEFFFKNAYIMEKEVERKKIVAAIEGVGPEATFRLLLLGYLHSNFLKPKFSMAAFERCLKIAFFYEGLPEFSPAEKKTLQQMFELGLGLDPTFTIFTNSFCMRLMGVRGNIYEITDFDFLAPFENEGRYTLWLSVLGVVAAQ